MNEFAISLIQTGPEDEVTQPGVIPDVEKNWADNIETRQYVIDNVMVTADYARNQRKSLEVEWQEIRRLGLLKHDANQKYIGRSNVYIPAYARARDVLVSQIVRGLFPSDDFMDVNSAELDPAMDPSIAEEDARLVKSYIQYEFDKCARIRLNIKPMLRQYVQYGWGISKMWYAKNLKSAAKGRVRSILKEGKITQELQRDLKREGVRFQARDIYSTYVWPPTVDSIEEATMVFEDIDLPIQYVKQMAKLKKWSEAEQAINAPVNPDHDFNKQQFQLENMVDGSLPTEGLPATELSSYKTLTEVWTNIPLPRSAYVGDEEPGTPVAVRILYSGTSVHEVKRQPFWHGRLPYLSARMTSEPGQFYPKGSGYMGKGLQYLINDLANQMNDNMTYGLNPVVLVNPSNLAGPLSPIRPGAVWQTTDTQAGIKFDRPPVEQIQYAQGLASGYRSELNDDVGSPPILQGTNAGKGARTATSSQILNKNANNPIQDMVEDLEGDIMVPAMEMAHSLGTQFRTEDVSILVDGKPKRLTPEQLVKDCTYKWLASSQSANSQQRAQGLMMMLQQIAPLMPLLQLQGKMIDPLPILEKVWTDGLGQRNFARIVKPMPMQPMQPGAPGAPGGALPPGMNPQDMQTQDPNQDQGNPSGNEEFADVRDNADAISANAGGEF